MSALRLLSALTFSLEECNSRRSGRAWSPEHCRGMQQPAEFRVGDLDLPLQLKSQDGMACGPQFGVPGSHDVA